MCSLILALSIIFQYTAAGLAFRLMRITKQSRGWGLIATAITLMAIRRSITGYQLFTSHEAFTLDMYAESVALGISILMVIGLASIAPFFLILRQSESVIQQSEKRYKTLAKVSPVGIFHTDKDGNYLNVNERWYEITGLPMDKAIREQWGDTLHPEDKQLVYHTWQEAIQKNGQFHLEYRFLRNDGSTKWVYGQAHPEFDETANIVSYVGTMTDISERKNAEEEFRGLMESAPDAMVIVDSKESIVRINQQTESLFGYHRDELIGQPVEVLIPPRFRKPHSDNIHRFFENTRVREMGAGLDLYGLRKNGSEFPIEISLGPIESPAGLLVSAAIRDITIRKQADVKLRESEERFRQLAESINQVFWLTDWKNKKLLYVSPAYEKLFGKSVESAYQDRKNWLHDIHPEDRERVSTSFANHAKQGKFVEEEYRLLRTDGTVCWIKDRAYPVVDDEGMVTRIVGIAEDITEWKNNEYEKTNLEAQLRQSQKLEAIGQLAGGVAHDFNNILTAIIGNAELLLRKATTQTMVDITMKAGLDQIDRAAKRAAKLTRQLLTFSRKQVLRPIDFELNKILIDMKPMLVTLMGNNIDIVTMPTPSSTKIRADMGQMEQVVMNLTINARDALPEGGQIVLKTEIVTLDDQYVREHPGIKSGSYTCLDITDNGTGMDAETKERIFEPFFTTKPVGQGTGLGLSTVYGIVKQSGGHIVTSSTPGVGTNFKLYFPAIEPHQNDEDNMEQPESTTLGGDETILICEDEESVLLLTKQTLEDRGYNVLAATNGDQALEIATAYKNHIHLLITDAIMPGMNGRELAESLIKYRSTTKVLYTSGYSSDILERDHKHTTELAFLQKPFDSQDLLKSVKKCLDRCG